MCGGGGGGGGGSGGGGGGGGRNFQSKAADLLSEMPLLVLFQSRYCSEGVKPAVSRECPYGFKGDGEPMAEV